MKKSFTKKNGLIFIILLFLLIQSIQIDKTNEPINPTIEFISMTSANHETKNILKSACYDCHSNESHYPWYTNIAPISWWIKHHINEGREHLNFSNWGNYSEKQKHHKLEECVEMIEEVEMPMTSYTWMHQEAKLTDDQKMLLVNFFKGLQYSSSLQKSEQKH